ncbi:oxidoreductase [Paenibacillus sp. P32E]|uniref:oxidoreductase n=1 Tax=Paenibacillus sp. P32E TaxID=1349434 RepID=UPI0009FAC403|nr:oxidoreductase [Paenibacillus sp. P32E]
MENKVWFVTGASTGLGKAIVLELIAKKCKVVATSRNPLDIEHYLPGALENDNLLVLPLDVTNSQHIKSVVEATKQKFGGIDVLVNNAGYAYFSPVENADDQQIENMFAVNFWGVKHMIDHVLPIMREQKSGTILNISSLGGLRAFAGFGYYHATKFALEGFSESLSQEVKPLGINISLVEPGDFNTDFASRSATENVNIIEAYQATAGENIKSLRKLSGHQPGDPNKAAKVIYDLVNRGDVPLRILLGSDAYQRAMEKLTGMQKTFSTYHDITISTDY